MVKLSVFLLAFTIVVQVKSSNGFIKDTSVALKDISHLGEGRKNVSILNNNLQSFKLPNFDVLSCIQVTRDIADLEEVLYNAYGFGKTVIKSAEGFWRNVSTCRSASSDDFELAECVIVLLEGGGSIFENILSSLYNLVSELGSIPILNDAKECLGFSEVTCLSC